MITWFIIFSFCRLTDCERRHCTLINTQVRFDIDIFLLCRECL